MDKEGLKNTYSMKEVAERYGFRPSRAGFIPCPFHQGDREPSLKIYAKDFHCHACGAHGDIFTFVEKMEGVAFKEAFQILGGTYEMPSFTSSLAVYRAKKRREMKRKHAGREQKKRALNQILITVYRSHMERSEPLSDTWCDCYNALQYQLYLQSEMTGMEARW